ncbi:F0F1 ATP synthase subunit B [Sesbania bispinosa]|nr:F0F1 ATP synthase subunit B [Sesbania bispinosa]
METARLRGRRRLSDGLIASDDELTQLQDRGTAVVEENAVVIATVRRWRASVTAEVWLHVVALRWEIRREVGVHREGSGDLIQFGFSVLLNFLHLPFHSLFLDNWTVNGLFLFCKLDWEFSSCFFLHLDSDFRL